MFSEIKLKSFWLNGITSLNVNIPSAILHFHIFVITVYEYIGFSPCKTILTLLFD